MYIVDTRQSSVSRVIGNKSDEQLRQMSNNNKSITKMRLFKSLNFRNYQFSFYKSLYSIDEELIGHIYKHLLGVSNFQRF